MSPAASEAVGEHQVYEVHFARGREIRYISHLDMMRLWERMLRRAGLPVAYSGGFNPRPKLAFAAPLPVGVLATDEVAEFTLEAAVPRPSGRDAPSTEVGALGPSAARPPVWTGVGAHSSAPASAQADARRPQTPIGADLGRGSSSTDAGEVLERLLLQAPRGLSVISVEIVPSDRPALQARLREAHYAVRLWDGGAADLNERVQALLASEHLPITVEREGKVIERDLRPLILDASVEEGPLLRLRLRQDPQATGRPVEVLQALGLGPLAAEITRTALVLVLA